MSSSGSAGVRTTRTGRRVVPTPAAAAAAADKDKAADKEVKVEAKPTEKAVAVVVEKNPPSTSTRTSSRVSARPVFVKGINSNNYIGLIFIGVPSR